MEELMKFVQNEYIYVPMVLWCCIQIFKMLYDLVKTKKINVKRLVGAGGMPSSHSAVVTSIATLIAKNHGIDTPLFALAFVHAFIVMYDACGVRRAAGKQAAILNRIINTPNLKGVEVKEKLVEVLGHTPIQVIVGALVGIIVGVVI